MAEIGETWRSRWARFLVFSLLALVVCASLTGSALAQTPDNQVREALEEEPGFWVQIVRNLFPWPNVKGLLALLKAPKYMIAAMIAVNIIVFVETGLLIGFFLPGDSLLVIAGIACANANWPLSILLFTVCLSAIVGDTVGYAIGYKTGPRIFTREKSWFFRKDHLLAAQKFYELHGGKTIILARFVPIIRTFAPVVAGVGKMSYSRFLFYNVFGGVGWVVSMILIGFFLEPPLQKIFGADFKIEEHVEKVIILVVLVSISPGIFVWLRKRLKGKQSEPAEVAETPEVLNPTRA